MGWLYILYSKKADRFYIGSTAYPVEQRLRKHLTNHRGYTSRFKDWVIAYKELYGTYNEARKREMELKRSKDR
ncbi:MAG: GIY-YIG nuclease family protein [Bacteroidia bacterium]|nr:GIY-YIG nuclease family protein [Bacteroidia bacterium]MBP7437094.1 GIY-YIG nuclease family protein [Bacteroidia bacterium]MBP7728871.1 GIY-YIG nuclease family protein [Bacteroidia bacterium]